MTDIEFLQSIQIHKLQTAARMAGLRWKNGDPAYNKEGVIRELQFRPSVMRATIANIKAMEKGIQTIGAPSSNAGGLLDDIAAESGLTPAPAPMVSPVAPPVAPVGGFDLSEYLKRTEWAQGRQSDTLQHRAIVENLKNETARGFEARDAAIAEMKAAIIELEKRAPVQMVINNKPLPVVSGQHPRFIDLVEYLQINRRVILTGSAGTGKSMAVKNAAEILGQTFYLQTPVTQSHELLGYRDAQGVFHESPLFCAYTRGGLILMDEADASMSDALLCANPIFDGNGFAMFGDGKLHAQHPDFMVVFNMNTDGNGATIAYPGRQPLDGATLARFGVRIHWQVSSEIEEGMAGGFSAWLAAVRAVRALMEARRIVQVNATPRHVKTGALLLAARPNRNKSAMLADILKSGALVECWNDIENLPAVRNFLQS
jgi:hypothetical protein